MIIDNFDELKKIMFFDSKKEYFYFVQIMMRKKDMPDKIVGDKVVLKTMYIDSMEALERKTPIIKDLCDNTGGRAYIHPMPKSYKEMTKQMLKILSDKIFADDFQSPQTVAEKSAGIIKGVIPRWIVDLDNVNEDVVEIYKNIINHQCEPLENTNKVVTRIKTKNGFHLITEPFNVKHFQELLKENQDILEYFNGNEVLLPDIHKNNPTVLYVNDAKHKNNGEGKE